MNLATRLTKLEQRAARSRPSRIAVRFYGRNTDDLPQPSEDQNRESTLIIDVRFVTAEDGRPV